MKLPEIGVRRPVLTAMLFIGILLFGIVSFKMLPTDVLPDIELPSLTVITVYPGASANEVEQQVTKKLEEVLSGTTNLKKITSTSKENVSFISLQFQWKSDLNEASNNVRDMIEMARRKLPSDAENPVIYKINSSLLPVIIYGVNAKESYDGISEIIEKKITSPVKKVPGVGTVLVIGQPTREIKVNVDPVRLNAYKVSISQVAQSLKINNMNIPGGNIKTGGNEFAVRIPGEFTSTADLGNTVVASFAGQGVRIRDIADIRDSYKEKDEKIRVDDKHAIALMVQKQSGANTLDVANATRSEIEQIRKTLPPDVEIKELLNTSELIASSIGNLSETIWYAAVFVMVVVFLFLRNYRSSLIIILTIPFSLIVAFIYMYIAGYTVNIFSLMSLAIAIGMVVDNAIVVLDNITRHIENGESVKEAAISGTKEMGLAISASTFTIIAVFLPMIFMGGIVGIIFKQLAILTSVTILASLVTSLMLTPMMSSRMLRPMEIEKLSQNKLYSWSEKIFLRLEGAYKQALSWTVRHRTLIIGTSIAIFLITLWFGRNTGTDYIPEFDAGDLTLVIQTEVGTSVEETEKVTKKVEQIVKEEVPEIVSMFSVVGQTEDGILSSVGFKEGKNMATIMVKIEPPEKRNRSSKEIAGKIASRIRQIPQVEKFTATGGSILSSAILGNSKPVQINVVGSDFHDMNQVADQVKSKLQEKGWLSNVETTVDKGKLELRIDIDKDKASQMGLNTAMIAMQVRQGIYGADAGEYKENGEDYQITVRYDSAFRNNMQNLDQIALTTLTGQNIFLGSVATVSQGTGPLEINREAQQRIVTVSADLKGISLGEANKKVQKELKSIDLPAGITLDFGGQVKDQSESFSDLWLMFAIGILLIYMIMASQFESLKDPFVIMFTIPLSIIGVLWAFMITGLTLSVVTFIGVIMLLGIDVNNGIILVDYTNQLRKKGAGLLEAAAEAGRLRLRPVLMTSLTAILGMVPMAVSSGMGSEIWSPLGVTCIGGLIVSKLFTMFLIPVLYVSIHKKSIESKHQELPA